MGILSRLEAFLERLFEAPAGRLGASIQPISLSKRIERAMDTNKSYGSGGVIVPNRYALHLNPADFEGFASYRTALEDDLAHGVMARARHEHYTLVQATVGGAIWANAGAHDGEMSHVIREVDVYDGEHGRRRMAAAEGRFAYRESRFKHSDEVVLGGTLELETGDPLTIEALIDEHQAERLRTQPLADQNAGSVFRNPPGDHAGRLIEAAGLKGHRVGTASVSTLHANFIVTDRGAGRAADVRALGDAVRATVADRSRGGARLRDRVRRSLGSPRRGPLVTRVRVGIFAGGRSAEHEVSVASAEAVLRAIDRDRFEPYLLYIDREGGWHLPDGPAPLLEPGATLAGLLGTASPSEEVARLRAHEAARKTVDAPHAVAPRSAVRSLADAIDVAFLVVHGPYGEDGTLQGFLELAGIPYVGAGVLASAVAMDKVVFKDVMRGHGLPVVDSTWFRHGTWLREPDRVTREIAELLGSRTVVKPARLGSSIGMSIAHDLDELPGALDEAFTHDSKVIVEAYVVDARELECGILGTDDPIVFEPGEIRSSHEFYDYEAKYVAGLADVEPRAAVDPELSARLRELSLAAYRAIDGAGLARVDFLVTPADAYISEINTLPGFTATSMYPKQAELAGVGFGELISRLVELGMERER